MVIIFVLFEHLSATLFLPLSWDINDFASAPIIGQAALLLAAAVIPVS